MPDGSNPIAGPVRRTVDVWAEINGARRRYSVSFEDGRPVTVQSRYDRSDSPDVWRNGSFFYREGGYVHRKVRLDGVTGRAAVAAAREAMAEEARKAEVAAKQRERRQWKKAAAQDDAAAERSAPTRAEAPPPEAGACFICGKPDAWGPARVLPPLVLVCGAGCAADPRFAGSAA